MTAKSVVAVVKTSPETVLEDYGKAMELAGYRDVIQPQHEKAPEKAQGKVAEPKLDEIWRPRRQGRHQDRAKRRFAGAGEPAKDAKDEARPARRGSKDGRQDESRHKDSRQHKGHERRDRHERRQGPPARRDERPQRSFRHSASPATKGGIDPDSPFAALSSLKAALEKQSQD